MNKRLEKNHWYDGWIYAKLIDTQPIPFRHKILNYLNQNSTVLDVGCGTGGFTMEISKKCKHVVGIDISRKQILQAQNRIKNSEVKNIEFIHINAKNIVEIFDTKFDFALLTLILHEINHQDRIELLEAVSKIAETIIILEYNVPHPYNVWGILTRTIEFFAGKNHFTNFLDFKKRGGINKILKESNFQISEEKINSKNIFKIVLASTNIY